jgi:hypothetical protein
MRLSAGISNCSAAIRGRGTVLIKARVAVDDCHENFWRLLDFLGEYKDIDVPHYAFRVTDLEDIELARVLREHDKESVLAAVKIYLAGQFTEQDLQMLFERRKALDYFDRLLSDDAFFDSEREQRATTTEGLWQKFFEENIWIFGYGLTLVACEKYSDRKLEQITTGSNVFTGGGKRSDAVMRTRGFIQTLLFAEIKTHRTPLLAPRPYREPDVYRVSDELNGAVSQVQKTVHKAIKHLEDIHRTHTPRGIFQFEVSTIRPRQVVVAGSLSDLTDSGQINLEKMTSFELYRRDHQGVEILTFVDSQETGTA